MRFGGGSFVWADATELASGSSVDLRPLLFAAMHAVGTAFTLAGFGFLLVKLGVITRPVRKSLATVSMKLTIPCLLFTATLNCPGPGYTCSSLVGAISGALPLLFLPWVYVSIGMFMGLTALSLVDRFIQPVTLEQRLIGAAAAAFGNSTGLPIVLGTALVASGVYGKMPDMEDNLLRYQAAFLLFYPMLQWSMGRLLLGGSLAEQLKIRAQAAQTRPSRPAPRGIEGATGLAARGQLGQLGDPLLQLPEEVHSMNGSAEDITVMQNGRMSSTDSLDQMPGTPVMAPVEPPAPSRPLGMVKKPEAPGASSADLAMLGTQHSKKAAQVPLSQLLIKAAMVPPVIATVSAVAIGFVTPVRAVLVDGMYDEGESRAPLDWFYQGLQAFGKSAVPINMLVLGSSLASVPSLKGVPWGAVLAVVGVKMVINPLVGLLTTKAIIAYFPALISSNASAFATIALLCSATPTSNNLMVMAQDSTEEARDLLSVLVFCMYCLAPFSLTAWLVVFLQVIVPLETA
mmetsp:Transcript_35212/g.92258  ORF Transcript_35212/g.92258 Transcript_35212/m.92258 type:complete len:515 (-) Transcript_35212:132-1676(-)